VTGEIEVRYGGVEELADALGTTAERLASLVEPIEAAGHVASGSPAVDAELARVAAEAAEELARVAEELAADAADLAAAVAAYAQADQQAAAAGAAG
jgi:cell pole-organizing protein PopZ